MNVMSNIESKIIQLAQVVSLIALIGLLILAAMIVGEGLLRWLLNLPILSVPDIYPLVITVAVAACFPLVFAERRNITVRLVGNFLGHRISMILEAFGYLVSIVIFCIMIWQLWIFSSQVAISNETTVAIRMPIAPWYRAATLLIALCVPIQIIIFCSYLKSAFFYKGVAGKNEVQKISKLKEKDT